MLTTKAPENWRSPIRINSFPQTRRKRAKNRQRRPLLDGRFTGCTSQNSRETKSGGRGICRISTTSRICGLSCFLTPDGGSCLWRGQRWCSKKTNGLPSVRGKLGAWDSLSLRGSVVWRSGQFSSRLRIPASYLLFFLYFSLQGPELIQRDRYLSSLRSFAMRKRFPDSISITVVHFLKVAILLQL